MRMILKQKFKKPSSLLTFRIFSIGKVPVLWIITFSEIYRHALHLTKIDLVLFFSALIQYDIKVKIWLKRYHLWEM